MKRFFVLNGLLRGDDDLVDNWENVKEVEIEFEEREQDFKVIGKWWSCGSMERRDYCLKILYKLCQTKKKK